MEVIPYVTEQFRGGDFIRGLMLRFNSVKVSVFIDIKL